MLVIAKHHYCKTNLERMHKRFYCLTNKTFRLQVWLKGKHLAAAQQPITDCLSPHSSALPTVCSLFALLTYRCIKDRVWITSHPASPHSRGMPGHGSLLHWKIGSLGSHGRSDHVHPWGYSAAHDYLITAAVDFLGCPAKKSRTPQLQKASSSYNNPTIPHSQIYDSSKITKGQRSRSETRGPTKHMSA